MTTVSPAVRVRRYPDADELAWRVAQTLVSTISTLQTQQQVVHLCLASGRTATAVYGKLGEFLPHTDFDPGRLELWWADETYIATEEQGRHAGETLSLLGRAFPLSPSRTHPMPARGGHQDVSSSAIHYADELGDTVFDICLLSLGAAGQVASIFPGQPPDLAQKSTVLSVTDAPYPPSERLTITMPLITRSRHVWVMASGSYKAGAVADCLNGYTSLPGARAVGREGTVWFVDADAATSLPQHRCAG